MRLRGSWRCAVALLCWTIACDASPRASRAGVDSIVAPGESLYVRQEFDSAATFWERSLRAPGVGGTQTEARLLTKLAQAAWRLGDYPRARRFGDSSLALKRALGVSVGDRAESQNVLGLVAWDEGRLQDASAFFAEAVAGYRESGNRLGLSKASSNAALIAKEFGRYAEARRGFDSALAAVRIIGNQQSEGRTLTNLAIVETEAGDPRAALARLDEARRLAESASDYVNLENILGQRGAALAALGDAGQAIAVVDSALEFARRRGLRTEQANDLSLLASLYRDAGDLDRAVLLYEQARTLNDSLTLAVEAGIVLRELASLRAARGSVDDARADIGTALAMHRRASATLQEFNDYILLASLDIDSGRLADAERELTAASVLASQMDAPQSRVELALARSRLALRRGDADRAVRFIGGVRDQLSLGAGASAIEAEWLLTRAFAALGRLDSAVAAGRRAVATIERSRMTLSSPALRTSFTADRSAVFGDLALALLRIGQVDEAFAVADAARGRSLLEYLSGARTTARRSLIERDLTERERLLREIDALITRLQNARSQPRQERGPDDNLVSRELERQLARARADYEALIIRLAERDPARAGIAGAKSASVADVRAALAEGETLVEYFATPKALLVFVVSRKGVRALQHMVDAGDLENRVRLARSLVASRRDARKAEPVLVALHDLLIAPVERTGWLRQGSRFIVIPHGNLSYLPFASLQSAVTGRYVMEDYAVEFLPVASALPALRGRRDPAATYLTRVLAPLTSTLRATAAEARAVSASMPGVTPLIDGSATELAMRAALRDGAMIHVATHGVMLPGNPLFSGIQLAAGRGQDSDDDGSLEVHELLGLTSTSPLVFLSGCETALGGAGWTPFARHEDYATLAQAFLFTGVRGVVATLWRIDDEGAAHFAERFYAHLRDVGAVQALAGAQRDLRAEPRWSAPYYWAGYVLTGDGPAGVAQIKTAVSVSR